MELFERIRKSASERVQCKHPRNFMVWVDARTIGNGPGRCCSCQRFGEGNREYLAKLATSSLCAATGRAPMRMLAILQSRLLNPPEEEIRVAAAEQNKITLLTLGEATDGMSGISTHVLDTAKGLPAQGVRVVLERRSLEGGWVEVSSCVTDEMAALRDSWETARHCRRRLTG